VYENPEVKVTRKFDRPLYVLFWLKSVSLLMSFEMLLAEFFIDCDKVSNREVLGNSR
jgi:hypothetical protein